MDYDYVNKLSEFYKKFETLSDHSLESILSIKPDNSSDHNIKCAFVRAFSERCNADFDLNYQILSRMDYETVSTHNGYTRLINDGMRLFKEENISPEDPRFVKLIEIKKLQATLFQSRFTKKEHEILRKFWKERDELGEDKAHELMDIRIQEYKKRNPKTRLAND